MEVYRLSGLGEQLAHNARAPKTPKWGVIFFLARRGVATSDQILENVPGATSATLGSLSGHGIIIGGKGVTV